MVIAGLRWVAASLAACLIALVPMGSRPSASEGPGAARTPVLVELFTSEGCSSCPPADAFLARLESQQPLTGTEIIAIEEHVDYWDQLGWRDPFSSADWTERQRRYAGVLGNGNIYTPQMIVNGLAEFVGSRERAGVDAIEHASERPALPITITSAPISGKHAAEISVRVDKLDGAALAADSDVWLAITEVGLQSSVTRGENAGRDLRHASVLRKLQKLGSLNPKSGSAASPTFAAKVSFDSSWRLANLHAVAFIQERRSLRVSGAAQIAVSR